MKHVETERKYAVASAADLLVELAPAYALGPARRFELAADYVDTMDLALIRAGYSLRRREGGADEGWHLKFPKSDDSRVQLTAPLGAGRSPALVPRALRVHVADVLQLDALIPVARLVTDRTERDILRVEDHAVVAVIADDHVTSTAVGGHSDAWREIEIDLVEGSLGDLEAIEVLLLEAGLTRSSSRSKVARSLGLEEGEVAEDGAQPAPLTAGRVAMRYIRRQIGTLQGLEGDVRRDVPGAVHKARVATRRLRSSLRTFRRLFDRSVTDSFAAEVRWLGEMLGGPRDAEVLQGRIIGDLDALPPEQIVGNVRERLERRLDTDHRAAHEVLVHALDSERMAELMESAVEMLRDPPLSPRAALPAREEMRSLVRKAERRVERARAAAAAEHEEANRLHLLHEVRKKAKAARYAHEALDVVSGSGSAPMAERWESVTDSLGEFQDTVVVRARLSEMAGAAAAAGDSTTTDEILLRREHDRGIVALATATKQVDELTTRERKSAPRVSERSVTG
ncbi:MAG: CYTH and CHAD domain-containing protein [Micrococcales bacterium]|nr:CYTH and CHAD domain-containing protein [Micrococcales bacterium]